MGKGQGASWGQDQAICYFFRYKSWTAVRSGYLCRTNSNGGRIICPRKQSGWLSSSAVVLSHPFLQWAFLLKRKEMQSYLNFPCIALVFIWLPLKHELKWSTDLHGSYFLHLHKQPLQRNLHTGEKKQDTESHKLRKPFLLNRDCLPTLLAKHFCLWFILTQMQTGLSRYWKLYILF